MNVTSVDFTDIQGLVRFGYGKLTEATFLLLKINDPAAVRAWLTSAPVTNAVKLDTAPEATLQVAFSSAGLKALGLDDAILAQFSDEFLSGMSGDENRSRRLGDMGADAPQQWRWGSAGYVPDVLVMLYACEGKLAAWQQAIQGPHWGTAFTIMKRLDTSNLCGIEPFGFADGISQPTLDWDQRRIPAGQNSYCNTTALGEFLLGYSNEYGRYTDRPLVPSSARNASLLTTAEDILGMHDFGRNGTYLVFRQLQQDVRGFWRFLEQQSASAAERQSLGETMVGRRMTGEPLVPLCSTRIPGIANDDAPRNNFDYETDPNGTHCPFGAHIRRANPRNGDFPSRVRGGLARLLNLLGLDRAKFRDDAIASTRFHRLLRRGREYGPVLSIEDALNPGTPDPGEHGIHFIALNANIARQFEFVQGAWIMSINFNAMTEESDPLLGNREPIPGCALTDVFSIPQQNALRKRITGLPRFITVRGGAYFFLPGLCALRYLASL